MGVGRVPDRLELEEEEEEGKDKSGFVCRRGRGLRLSSSGDKLNI